MDTPDNAMNAKRALVSRGVDLFDKAETKLDQAYVAILALADLIRDANKIDMVGGQKTMVVTASLMAAAGAVMGAKAEVAKVHEWGTAVAIDQGVDVPQPRGGGSR